MGWRSFFGFIFILMTIFLLGLYWFIPFDSYSFEMSPRNSNFSLNSFDSNDLQFYDNMRFPTSSISYKIKDCSLQKKYDMERAFDIIEEKTILDFYPVLNDEEISIACDSTTKIKGGLFIAGEGGPTNITKVDDFYVILNGNILLIRDSKCGDPNIAIHELLHVLGFDHSNNRNNVMYNITSCKQDIGSDLTNTINKLYSLPSYPDLAFEEVSASMYGRYLSSNISVRNIGFKDSQKANIKIYADGKVIKEVLVDELKIGHGKIIILTNIWVNKLNVDQLEFVVFSDFDELDKDNNKIILEVKK